MEPLGFFEVVRVLDSATTRRLGIVGRRGVVLGMPPHLVGIEDDYAVAQDEAQYAVDIDAEGYALVRSDLEGTGEFVDREAFYPGDRLLAQAERYQPKDSESSEE